MKVLILGTRTLAEEVADVVSEIPGCEVAGFVENMDRERCRCGLGGLPVHWIDDIDRLAADHYAVCALSTTKRKAFVEQAAALGMRFPVLVHPAARVSSCAQLSDGCFISPLANVSARTVLGEQVFVNRGALIGHHSRIGDYCTIQPGANIAGMVTVGAGTYVGMSSAVIDNIYIGAGCVIGSGAVVVSDVPDRVQVLGVPARIVKTDIEGK